MPDATLRQIEMLRLVPRAPRSITVSRLAELLSGSGYEVNVRTVQRDLNALSIVFDLRNEREGRIVRWQWAEHAEMLDLAGMSPLTALSMFVVEHFLNDQMPRSITGFMAQQFEQAREVLKKSGDPNAWMNKVRVIPRSQRLIQPRIDEEILRVIFESLINDQKFVGRYIRKGMRVSSEVLINPLGIVFREGLTYLVATQEEETDVLLFALHGFRGAVPSNESSSVPKGFKLDRYLNTQGPFDSYKGKYVTLEFKASSNVIQSLRETPLSHDQGLSPCEGEDEWDAVKVRIRETDQLKRSLLSFGPEIVIMKPTHLREWAHEKLTNAAKRYES